MNIAPTCTEQMIYYTMHGYIQ